MRLKIILSIILIGCYSILYSQSISSSIIASAGGYASNENLNVSSTLGDLVIRTFQSTEIILTQGFQQPLILGTGIPQNDLVWDIKSYPNPVSDKLHITFKLKDPENLTLIVSDLLGKNLIIKHLKNTPVQYEYSLDVSSLEKGIYLLGIRSDDYKTNEVIRFQKQ